MAFECRTCSFVEVPFCTVDEFVSEHEFYVRDMLADLLGGLRDSNTLPRHLCRGCFVSLKDAHSFRRMFIETQKYLKKRNINETFTQKNPVFESISFAPLKMKYSHSECDYKCNYEKSSNNHSLSHHQIKSETVIDGTLEKTLKLDEKDLQFQNLTVNLPNYDLIEWKQDETFSKNFSIHNKTKAPEATKQKKISKIDSTINPYGSKLIVQKQKYQCNNCDYSTEIKGRLINHMSVHRRAKKYKRFKSNTATEPQRITVQKQKYQCDNCDYSTKIKYRLIRHMSVHRRRAKSYNSFKSNSTADPYLTAVRKQKYQCDNCDYSSDVKGYLFDHMWVHSAVKRYKCDKCIFRTDQKRYLRKHQRKLHNSRISMYYCDKCKYATYCKSYLNSHLLTHATAKRYACVTCDYSTNWRGCFAAHVLKHDNVKKYHCDHCEYGTNHKPVLRRHMLVHATVKRFGCKKCDYRANRQSSLVSHMQFRHGVFKRNA